MKQGDHARFRVYFRYFEGHTGKAIVRALDLEAAEASFLEDAAFEGFDDLTIISITPVTTKGAARVTGALLLAVALVVSGAGTARASARPVAADPTVRESRSWICVVGPRESVAYVGTFRSQKKAAEWCARVDRRPCAPVRLWLPAKEATK